MVVVREIARFSGDLEWMEGRREEGEKLEFMYGRALCHRNGSNLRWRLN